MTTATTDAEGADVIGWLAERDVPCPLCTYNLRGLTTPRCPECGQLLRLSVALVDPFHAAWLTMVVAAWVAGGAGLFLGAIILAERRWPHISRVLDVSMIAFLVAIPLAVFVTVTRRRFLRLSRGVQRVIATLAVVASAGNLIVFGCYVR